MSKKQRKAMLANESFGNHPIIKSMINGNGGAVAMAKKGGKGTAVAGGGSTFANSGQAAEIKIEELDEELLRKRLEALEADLSEYKRKCQHYKTENEWYRAEIDATKKDTAEYIEYLHLKKSEKQTAIDKLVEIQKQDQEYFTNRKKTRRARHEAEITKVRKEIAEADAKHVQAVSDLERSLLEIRMKLQKKQTQKSRRWKTLHKRSGKEFIARKDSLERENRELSRQLQVRDDMLKLRVSSILKTQALESKSKELRKDRITSLKSKIVAEALSNLSKARTPPTNAHTQDVPQYDLNSALPPHSASAKLRDLRPQNSRGSGTGSRAPSRGHGAHLSALLRDWWFWPESLERREL
ncbi:hypothetical protein BC829DRAFT_422629 [Chytridium lagenaria]|nr:hypothetical protein BC829DRAFT_422629 [Chytridium lagenaria]